MTFEFEDRNPEEIQHVNAALSAMPVRGIKLEDGAGYLAIRSDYDPASGQILGKTYMYGFDKLCLTCDHDENENAHVYQVDVQAFPKGEFADTDTYHTLWHADHPGRVMRVMQLVEFEDAEAYIVLHHEKV